MSDDYDKTLEWEANDELDRWNEAQDNARDARADDFEHREDVP